MEANKILRRRQFCYRCGGLLFEFYRSPDGHFGLLGDIHLETSAREATLCCPTCGGRYRLLDRVDAMGQPVARM